MRVSKRLQELIEKNRTLDLESGFEPAREYALRLLDMRDYPAAQIFSKLRARGYSEEIAQQVTTRLEDSGLVNDMRYASMFVRDKHEFRGLARRAIAVELVKKGIAREVAEAALEQLSSDDEKKMALVWAQKTVRSSKGLETERCLRKIVSMLSRKGYAPSLAFSMAKEALAHREEEENDKW
ncbi:recombination regulator RecX [Actinomycetaceae bacterium TAE3-ERU4]|nr:recombination regulator RecX [Actinomycetaceae bacterium TAE3-ERU4]